MSSYLDREKEKKDGADDDDEEAENENEAAARSRKGATTTTKTTSAAALEQWRKASLVLRSDPSLVTPRVLRLALRNRAPPRGNTSPGEAQPRFGLRAYIRTDGAPARR